MDNDKVKATGKTVPIENSLEDLPVAEESEDKVKGGMIKADIVNKVAE